MNIKKLKEICDKYNQEHLLKSYERLNEEEKLIFLNQLDNVNFEDCKKLFELTKNKEKFSEIKLEQLKVTDASEIPLNDLKEITYKGEKIIKNGKYAVVMMAGGQGTRLGHSGPKGTFDFGLESHKTIFQIFAEKFIEAKERLGVTIPWYIMTSKANNNETIKFFEEKNYFGYKDGIKKFFVQKELPMIDENGKLILEKDGLIKEGANGHGGVYEALVENGILDEMKKDGIEWVFICGVDNILAKLVDPILVGYAATENNKIVSISCLKNCPEEKVGVLCKKNGKPSVVEYTEMPEQLTKELNEKGELKYGESHLIMNLFNIDVISDIAKEPLPYHVAHKKSDFIDENGILQKADKPNAYKFERFLFDAFERLDEIGVLRYQREECYAPIKNAEGVDSPETARKLYKDYYGI